MREHDHGPDTSERRCGGDEPCVWMSAGLVAYKLCNHGFDCESCDFDRAMRGAAVELESRARPVVAEPDYPPFPDDRRYDRGHTWARHLGGGRVRIGIDLFAARLLSAAASIVLPMRGTALEARRIACWFLDSPESIPVRSPVSGFVLEANATVATLPRLVTESPYDEGWLLEVRCPEIDHELARLVGADEIRRRADEQLARLRAKTARYVDHDRAAVGPTLADGGERLVDLRRILGPARYRRLILPFLL